MWSAFVISLMVGLLAGYWYGKKVSARGGRSAPNLEEQLKAVQHELEQTQHANNGLLQEKADLKYQLGEEKKARTYAEQRVQKNKQDSE